MSTRTKEPTLKEINNAHRQYRRGGIALLHANPDDEGQRYLHGRAIPHFDPDLVRIAAAAFFPTVVSDDEDLMDTHETFFADLDLTMIGNDHVEDETSEDDSTETCGYPHSPIQASIGNSNDREIDDEDFPVQAPVMQTRRGKSPWACCIPFPRSVGLTAASATDASTWLA